MKQIYYFATLSKWQDCYGTFNGFGSHNTAHCSLENILSHEKLAVWPFSKEVLWSLSFPGGPFWFLIYCSVPGKNKKKKKTTCHFGRLLCVGTSNSFVVT